MSGNLSCIKSVKDTEIEERWDFPRDATAEKCLIVLMGESPNFSLVAAGNLGLPSSYDGNLRDPAIWPRKIQSPAASGEGLLSNCIQMVPGLLGPHLGTEAAGFRVPLSTADIDLGSEALTGSGSTHVETCKSIFSRAVIVESGLPVELTWGFVAFSEPQAATSATIL